MLQINRFQEKTGDGFRGGILPLHRVCQKSTWWQGGRSNDIEGGSGPAAAVAVPTDVAVLPDAPNSEAEVFDLGETLITVSKSTYQTTAVIETPAGASRPDHVTLFDPLGNTVYDGDYAVAVSEFLELSPEEFCGVFGSGDAAAVAGMSALTTLVETDLSGEASVLLAKNISLSASLAAYTAAKRDSVAATLAANS